MGVLDYFSMPKKEKDAAREFADAALSGFVEGLHIENGNRYRPKAVYVRNIKPPALYNPDDHSITFRKSLIDDYLKAADEVARLLDAARKGGPVQKFYEARAKQEAKVLGRKRRTLQRHTVHEMSHDFSYGMHPELSREERSDPVRRTNEEALGDFSEAILTRMSEDEIISTIEAYKSDPMASMREAMAELALSQYEAHEAVAKELEALKGKIGGNAREFHNDTIERGKRKAKAVRGSLQGYRIGLLAALGMARVPEEEKLAKMESLLKDGNQGRVFSEFENLAEEGMKVYREKVIHPSMKSITKGKTEDSEWEKAVADALSRDVYRPRKKRESNAADSAAIFLILGGSFSIFSISVLSLKKGITAMAVGASPEAAPHFMASMLFTMLLIAFAYLADEKKRLFEPHSSD